MGKRIVYYCLQFCFAFEEHVVSALSSCYSPHLLNWIQVRRIRWQFHENHLFPDICIFEIGFVFNQPNSLLVPWGVVYNHSVFLSFVYGVGVDIFPETFYHGLVIEPFGLGHKKAPSVRPNESAVRNLTIPGEGFDLWGTSFLVPCRRDCCLHLKMHFVLIYGYQVRIVLYRCSFFGKSRAPRSAHNPC